VKKGIPANEAQLLSLLSEHKAFSRWSKAFFERQFALQLHQTENDEQRSRR